MSSQSLKQYPRNDIYSKPPTRPPAHSGSSLSSSSPRPTRHSNPEIAGLIERIGALEAELMGMAQLLAEEKAKDEIVDRLERENEELRDIVGRSEDERKNLLLKLTKVEKDREYLKSSLNAANEEIQQLKKQLEIETKREISAANDSRNSAKSKEQVQEDIIKINEDISNIIEKFQSLNVDYEQLREKNAQLESQKQALSLKLSKAQEQYAQLLQTCQTCKLELEYSKQEISQLKQQIQQVNELSIRNQKQLQDEFYEKERTFYLKLQQSKVNSEEGKKTPTKKVQDENTLVTIKNAKIKSLQLDNQYLKNQIQIRDVKIRQLNQINQGKGRNFDESNKKLQEITETHREKVAALQRNYANKIRILQDQIRELESAQFRTSSVEIEMKNLRTQLRQKEQKILTIEQELREAKRKEFQLSLVQDEIRQLRSREEVSNKQYFQMQQRKFELMNELQIVKNSQEQLQRQVRITNEAKQRYGKQLSLLKDRIQQLTQLSENQKRQIREIEVDHERSRKKIEEISSISENHYTHRYDSKLEELEANNRHLQKMLMDEKIQKENQSKKYKQLLNDYKNLNEEMSTELQLYRDSQSSEHAMCPLKQSRDKMLFGDRLQSEHLKVELQKQKTKYLQTIEKYEKTVQKYKGIDQKLAAYENVQKQCHFLKIDNASMRAQLTQLNIRIQEYKATVSCLQRQIESRNHGMEQIRLSVMNEYSAKMDIQKMEIINQYNVLLRNRGVRIDPHLFVSGRCAGNDVAYSPSNAQSMESGKIKHHPEYKKLQEEYISMHRRLLESEDSFHKSLAEYKDEIQKLILENEFHRKTIDQLHAEGYGLCTQEGAQHDEGTGYRSKYEELYRNYQQLYQEYLGARSKNINEGYVAGQRLRQIFKSPGADDLLASADRRDMEKLKKVIDQKLIELQLTPREPLSIIERSIWFIQRISELISQLKTDRETLRSQKKETNKENDKLKVKLEALQYKNSSLLNELSIALEKLRFLQDRTLKMGSSNRSTQRQVVRAEDNRKSLEKTAENDVYMHQAGLIREERLAILRRYQKQIESGDSPRDI